MIDTRIKISYLLQRVEDFPGLSDLNPNLKANIDAAFAPLSEQSVFRHADASQRERLWRGLFFECKSSIKMSISRHRQTLLTRAGGALLNVARYAAIRAVKNQRDLITQDDLLAGIGRELMKDGENGVNKSLHLSTQISTKAYWWRRAPWLYPMLGWQQIEISTVANGLAKQAQAKRSREDSSGEKIRRKARPASQIAIGHTCAGQTTSDWNSGRQRFSYKH